MKSQVDKTSSRRSAHLTRKPSPKPTPLFSSYENRSDLTQDDIKKLISLEMIAFPFPDLIQKDLIADQTISMGAATLSITTLVSLTIRRDPASAYEK